MQNMLYNKLSDNVERGGAYIPATKYVSGPSYSYAHHVPDFFAGDAPVRNQSYAGFGLDSKRLVTYGAKSQIQACGCDSTACRATKSFDDSLIDLVVQRPLSVTYGDDLVNGGYALNTNRFSQLYDLRQPIMPACTSSQAQAGFMMSAGGFCDIRTPYRRNHVGV